VDVLVFTVEKIVENSVLVWALRERVTTDVPCRSTRMVDVKTGRVVDFETTFVAWKVEVNVWPGNMDVLMSHDVYVSVSVYFEAMTVLMDEGLNGIIDVLVD
jgi:hypothetical protein